jgi:ATP-dependent DNA helicase RecQ
VALVEPQLRRSVLERDRFRCRDCGSEEVAARLDVHHLVPRAIGGSDEPANLITLCDGCHAARHPLLQMTLGRRFVERWALRLARLVDRRGELPSQPQRLRVALDLLGAERFRDGQLEIVLAALSGESLLAIRPTGSGKSVCFQVPALVDPGVSYVVSPLKALMSDQISGLQRKRIPASFINSDLSTGEKKLRYEMLRDGHLKLLYLAPERLDRRYVAQIEVEKLLATPPHYLVVDEAHCIDRWGSDFRPSYGRLHEAREELGEPPVLAFTATAGRRSQEQILASLGIPDARVIVQGVDRPNIALCRIGARRGDFAGRADIVVSLLATMPGGHAMIFVPTVKVGQRVKEALASRGFDLPFYHANCGLPHEKDEILGRFTGRLEPPLPAVICTNAFGMGFDVPDVRLVVNWQRPAAVEDYLQEFGRAGRDGEPALALVFTDPASDSGLLQFMADRGIETAKVDVDAEDLRREKYERIDELGAAVEDLNGCFRKRLLHLLGADEPKSKPSLAIRIINWLYADRTDPPQEAPCCDSCNPKLRHIVLDRRWPLGDITTHLVATVGVATATAFATVSNF